VQPIFAKLPRESLDYGAPMGVEPDEQPMFTGSTYRIPLLNWSYGCATLSRAYVGYVYLQNHWVTLDIWLFNLKCSLCWLLLPSESLSYTSLIGMQS